MFRFDTAQSFETYLEELLQNRLVIANSARAAGVLSSCPPARLDGLYRFGRQLGLAFQVVDDILDFTGNDQSSSANLLPVILASGYLTAPTFYAMEEHPGLQALIAREFKEGDLEQALEMVRSSRAIPRTRELAEKFARESRDSITWMVDSPSKAALLELPDFVLSRL